MNIVSKFIESFIVNFKTLFMGTLGSTLPTSSYSSGSLTTLTGTASMHDTENTDANPLLGSTVITTGSAVIGSVQDVKKEMNMNQETVSAYIESMNQDELKTLMNCLEKMVEELPYKEEAKTLTKTINNNYKI